MNGVHEDKDETVFYNGRKFRKLNWSSNNYKSVLSKIEKEVAKKIILKCDKLTKSLRRKNLSDPEAIKKKNLYRQLLKEDAIKGNAVVGAGGRVVARILHQIVDEDPPRKELVFQPYYKTKEIYKETSVDQKVVFEETDAKNSNAQSNDNECSSKDMDGEHSISEKSENNCDLSKKEKKVIKVDEKINNKMDLDYSRQLENNRDSNVTKKETRKSGNKSSKKKKNKSKKDKAHKSRRRHVSRNRSKSRSRSPSIRRRPYSPSHLDRRRITSARKRPVPYYRPTSSESSDDSFASWRRRSLS